MKEIIGMWIQTWSPGTNYPEGINVGIAFSGWTDIATALSNSEAIFDTLPPAKFLSLGGGNTSGHWTAETLQANLEAINNGNIGEYWGVVFDCEEGDAGLAEDFEACFAALKTLGKQVIVTVSHTSPYGFPDAEDFMTAILSSKNIDYLSPQLYTNGNEPSNDYEAGVVQWSQWASTGIAIAPSIVTANLYPDAQAWFKENLNITLDGFIQWENN